MSGRPTVMTAERLAAAAEAMRAHGMTLIEIAAALAWLLFASSSTRATVFTTSVIGAVPARRR